MGSTWMVAPGALPMQAQPRSTLCRILHPELDKGKVYATLGKYITILAFEILAETQHRKLHHVLWTLAQG